MNEPPESSDPPRTVDRLGGQILCRLPLLSARGDEDHLPTSPHPKEGQLLLPRRNESDKTRPRGVCVC